MQGTAAGDAVLERSAREAVSDRIAGIILVLSLAFVGSGFPFILPQPVAAQCYFDYM